MSLSQYYVIIFGRESTCNFLIFNSTVSNVVDGNDETTTVEREESSTELDDDAESDQTSNDVQEQGSGSGDAPIPSTSAAYSAPRTMGQTVRKAKKRKPDEFEVEMLNAIRSDTEREVEREADGVRLFCLSLIPRIKMLSIEDQSLVQFKYRRFL